MKFTADALAREIADLKRRLRRVEGASAMRFRSVEGGAIEINDADGNPVTKMGLQDDGAYSVGYNIGETQITDSAISTPKLAANAVTADKISTGAITADKIAANAITADGISAGAITADEISTGAITADKIATDAVTADKISAGAVATSELAANAVTADKVSAGAITADKISANAVTADKISANALNGKVITGATMQTAASGLRWRLDSSKANSLQGFTGDASETSPGLIYMGLTGALLETNIASPVGAGASTAASALISLQAAKDGSLSGIRFSADSFAFDNGEGLRIVGQSGQPKFVNGWGNNNSTDAPVAFEIDALNYIRLQGVVSGGALGTTVFTLPAGYRPQGTQNFSTAAGGGATAQVRIYADGTVWVMFGPSGSWSSLTGIAFRQFG